MFTAAAMCIRDARNLIACAKILKKSNPAGMLEYLKVAEDKLTMAELYIK